MHRNAPIFIDAYCLALALTRKTMELGAALTANATRGFSDESFLPPAEFDEAQTIEIARHLAAIDNEKMRDKRVRRLPRRTRSRY